MIDANTYALLWQLTQHDEHRGSDRAHARLGRRRTRHRGLQRSAREIALDVRRQRRHGEGA